MSQFTLHKNTNVHALEPRLSEPGGTFSVGENQFGKLRGSDY